MNVVQRLLSKLNLRQAPPEPPLDPISAAERLDEISKYIKLCERETEIGSARTAEYAYRALARYAPEKKRLEQFLKLESSG